MSPAPDNAEPVLTGLTQHEAAERLRTKGYNELSGTRRHSLGIIALEVQHEPMFVLLIAAGVASVAWFEAFKRLGRPV